MGIGKYQVPLDLFSEDARDKWDKIWRPFIDYVDDIYDQDESLEHEKLLEDTLAKYNGVTDWSDNKAPIYFETQEDLVQFVLIWSK